MRTALTMAAGLVLGCASASHAFENEDQKNAWVRAIQLCLNSASDHYLYRPQSWRDGTNGWVCEGPEQVVHRYCKQVGGRLSVDSRNNVYCAPQADLQQPERK